MDFLVRIELQPRPDLAADLLRDLSVLESQRGNELVESGNLVGIWRVPGRRGNVSIWRAKDPSELHQMLESLPLYSWLLIEVQALARHPVASLLGAPA